MTFLAHISKYGIEAEQFDRNKMKEKLSFIASRAINVPPFGHIRSSENNNGYLLIFAHVEHAIYPRISIVEVPTDEQAQCTRV